MGRKAEPGISYYSMECNHTSHKKIKLLYNDAGALGYWVWQCVLSEGYNKKGYYFDMNDKDELVLFAQDICKVSIDDFDKIIDCCLKRNLFNEKLRDEFGILTSDRMQEKYIDATSERRRKGTKVDMRSELLLVDVSDVKHGNINLLPYEKTIIPGNNSVGDGNNGKSPKTEAEVKLKDLKQAWSKIPQPVTKEAVFYFIKNNRPTFIEPYLAMWNIWAIEHGKTTVSKTNSFRSKHFPARMKEADFDFLHILTKAHMSSFITNKMDGFSFDWIIKNDSNYMSVLEGKYDDKKKDEGMSETTKELNDIINNAEYGG